MSRVDAFETNIKSAVDETRAPTKDDEYKAFQCSRVDGEVIDLQDVQHEQCRIG